ncbi:MAG: hypothetical protein FRX49_10670 [Trebouxia sp. A1-2]|nr:MAG: hypothetical protein FRX49_10670 [Trebouxia sp. A1-2]
MQQQKWLNYLYDPVWIGTNHKNLTGRWSGEVEVEDGDGGGNGGQKVVGKKGAGVAPAPLHQILEVVVAQVVEEEG